MTERIVVMDIDGCLADFTWGFTGLIESRNRGSGTQTTWNFDASAAAIKQAWKHIDASKTWWQGLPPLVSEPDVYDFNQLAKRVTVVYMTGRQDAGNDTLGQTNRWLRMMGLPKGLIVLEGDKAAGCAALLGEDGEPVEIAGILEDRPRSINALSHAGMAVYARDWQYTRVGNGNCYALNDEATCYQAKRVSSLSEFAQRVGAAL